MSAQLPMTGIRVADFSWVGAGPFLTKPLADHGADVVKVESRTRVDPIRSMAPFRDAVTGTDRSGYFANRNTSKRSMCLDLKHPRGRELAMRLIEVSDVVVNNFSPGTMDRLGLGYDAARAARCHLSRDADAGNRRAAPRLPRLWADHRGSRGIARAHRLRRRSARRHRHQLSRPCPQPAARGRRGVGRAAQAATYRPGGVHRTRPVG